MNGKQKALVLGASGGIGGEVARQLRERGWTVRAMKRGRNGAATNRDGLEWVEGDALVAADVLAAAEGCDVIVHAVNPPGYRRWSELVLPMIDNTIAAACALRATVVLPGTVYNYGPDAFPVVDEDAPQNPLTRKGAIRVQLEQRLQAAAERGEMQAIIVRAGDFFGPRAGNSWVNQAMVKPGQPVRAVQLPGKPGTGHQFAYLPDVARTMAALIERRRELPPFARFHMAGHWDADGTTMARTIQWVTQRYGHSAPTLKAFPWWLVRLASPFVTTLRELLEMRYLWQQEVRMVNDKLIAFLGDEPHTPWVEAVEASLRGMGCLPSAASACATSQPAEGR
jgi:nucleoside-diphosphate-sugar epimerase